jgi:hypothetical protein
MKEVLFVDGRSVQVDADSFIIPEGSVLLLKRGDDGVHPVATYPVGMVRDVREYQASPVKIMAVKLLQVCGATPHGSRKLAELAGIEYSDLVLGVLKKLRAAGKVKFSAGKWTRVQC